MRRPISPEGIELRTIAETAFRALNAGDLDAFLEVVSEDVEFTSMIAEVDGVTFRGHDGVRKWWDTVRRAFEGIQWEMLEFEEAGARGIARLRAVGTLGNVQVEQTVWSAARFRDGKLEQWGFFRDEDEAREAAALVRRTDGG